MMENVDCKRLDRMITCQHQGVFMFHICIRSLLTDKKNEKNHCLFLIFCSIKLKFLRRETKGAIAWYFSPSGLVVTASLRLLPSHVRMRSGSFAKPMHYCSWQINPRGGKWIILLLMARYSHWCHLFLEFWAKVLNLFFLQGNIQAKKVKSPVEGSWRRIVKGSISSFV